jgi:hypothetical protein
MGRVLRMTRTFNLLLLPLFFMPLITDAATWYVDGSVAQSGDGGFSVEGGFAVH